METEDDLRRAPGVEYIGALEIVGTDLVDLRGLECTKQIGRVTIADNDQLQRLAGLESLIVVSDRHCDSMIGTDACELPEAQVDETSAGPAGDLLIHDNPALESLDGLEGLRATQRNFELVDNDALLDMHALTALVKVGTDLEDRFVVADNDALRSLPLLAEGDAIVLGEPNVVLFTVDVRANASLESMFAPGSVGFIHHLVIAENPALTDVSGFERWAIDRTVSLLDNDALREVPTIWLYDFDYCSDPPCGGKFETGVFIEDNDALQSVAGLAGTTYAYELTIRNNATLADLHGLEELATVEMNLRIDGNAALEDLDALDPSLAGSLLQIGGGTVVGNSSLSTCLVEALASQLEIGDSLVIEDNQGGCP